MIAIARERDADAGSGLARLRSQLARAKPDAVSSYWPEFVAATSALARPALRREALDLLNGMAEALDSQRADDALALHIRHARALAEREGPQAGPDVREPAFSYWRNASRGTAFTRSSGFPMPFWSLRDGELRHHPGHLDDALAFVIPLRGDFEVACDLNLDDRRSSRAQLRGTSA